MVKDKKKIDVKLTITGDPEKIKTLDIKGIVEDLQDIERESHMGVNSVSKNLHGVDFILDRIWSE